MFRKCNIVSKDIFYLKLNPKQVCEMKIVHVLMKNCKWFSYFLFVLLVNPAVSEELLKKLRDMSLSKIPKTSH